MSETLHRLIARVQYSGKSDADIDSYRVKKRDEYDQKGITGIFIFGEGNGWIELVGTESDINDEEHSLSQDPFFDAYQTDDNHPIGEHVLDYIYLYHEDRSPVAST